MEIKKNDDCTRLLISDDLISDYISQSPTPDHTLVFNIAVNDSASAVVEVTYDAGEDNAYATLSDFSMTDRLDDGIYTVEIVKTVTVGGAITKKKECAGIFCPKGMICEIVEYVASNLDSNVPELFYLLNNFNGCTEASCDDAIKIWEHLQDQLGIFTTAKTNDCGCG
jgi:hypothetical protein